MKAKRIRWRGLGVGLFWGIGLPFLGGFCSPSLIAWEVSQSEPTLCSQFLGSCDYYSCRESIQPCGIDGYWMRFGYQYCHRFMTQVKPRLSVEGQDWMDRVGRCLREEVELFPLSASCRESEDSAIRSHLGCYLETGFCQIPFLEKMRVLRTVYRELSEPRILKVFFKISRNCGMSLFFGGYSVEDV